MTEEGVWRRTRRDEGGAQAPALLPDPPDRTAMRALCFWARARHAWLMRSANTMRLEACGVACCLG
jgi:hypothetical protein